MIEKIERIDESFVEKINDLIGAVNELQKHEEQHLDLLTQLNEMRLHQNKEPAENVRDKFTEQRKWEGKLCWLWDEDPEDKIVDVLSCIDTSDKYPYVICDRLIHYKHCEPVKPDDDIIYKGGNNVSE